MRLTICLLTRSHNSSLHSSKSMTQQMLGKCLKMVVIKTQQISAKPIEKVIVHPLVLLSIVDTRKRVVSVLLGSSFKGSVCYQQLRSAF